MKRVVKLKKKKKKIYVIIMRLSRTALSLAVNPEMAPCVGRENTFEISCNDDWMIKVSRRRHAGTPGCSNCAAARGGRRIKYMSQSN